MKTTLKALLSQTEHTAQTAVVLHGWVRNNRAQKAFGFFDLHDGTHFASVQVVYEENLDNFKALQKIRVGSALEVKGTLVLTPEAPQPFEIKATEVNLVGDSPEDYPIQPKRHTREFLRTHSHLRVRTNLFHAVFRVRSVLHHAIHRFFEEQGYLHVAAPILTASDAEGAGEMFHVTTLKMEHPPKDNAGHIDYKQDFFGAKTHLTVSGQLQAEVFAQAFRHVYTFGPTFRAENSNTTTHASEFWMIEPEVAFADLNDMVTLATAFVKYLIEAVLNEAPSEMAFLNQFVQPGVIDKLRAVVQSDFKVLTHREAVTILKEAKHTFEHTPSYEGDLATEHEKYLVNHVGGPVFVIDWPKDIKAFYMRVNDDGQTVAAMDLLVPGSGELIGGSQREERYDVLVERMQAMNVDPEALSWYLDLRKYGSTPHAGFGLGFDRMLMYVTGVENIRDVIPFPRTPKNCAF